MAKVRNVSGEARFVPELNKTVDVDEVVDVPDARAESYTVQDKTWTAVGGPKKTEKEA